MNKLKIEFWIIITYSNDVHDKTIDFINNNIQTFATNPNVIYTKQINKLI